MQMKPFYMERPQELMVFENDIEAAGGTVLYVGGCVRDYLVGLKVNDYDLELYGVSYHYIADWLENAGYRIDLVGQSFGILKVWLPSGRVIDVGFPRKENRTGAHHRDFEVSIDPHMDPTEALARRDYTINALAYDSSQDLLLDPFGGEADLKARVLRHTSDRFSEDPLRVLRGFQFAGRMSFTMDPETAKLCQSLLPKYRTISRERVWMEWKKWAELSPNPGFGFDVLIATKWYKTVPALKYLNAVELHHASVRLHQLGYFLELYPLAGEARIAAVLAALFTGTDYDFMCDSLEQLMCPKPIQKRARSVATSLDHLVTENQCQPNFVRFMAKNIRPASIRIWVPVSLAHRQSFNPRNGRWPEVLVWQHAERLGILDAPEPPIITGDHLINAGIAPCPEFKDYLETAYNAQLSGSFEDEDEALDWLADWLKFMDQEDLAEETDPDYDTNI